MTKKNIAIIADDVTLGSPAQQILDRLLIGFARDGVFEKRPVQNVTLWTADQSNKLVEQRTHDFSLSVAKSRNETLNAAEAVVFVSSDRLIEVIETVRVGTPVFVYGLLGKTKTEAGDILRKAAARNIPIVAGTVMATLQQLPPMDIPSKPGIGAQIREALIVVEGPAPQAELAAFDALVSILDRYGGVRRIHDVRSLEGSAVWEAADREWSWRMLAAALSRTDKAQGNTLLDGRTEDIVGLGFAQKMAKNPRARIIRYSGGLRSSILVLDGVVADVLLAVKAGRRLMPGTIYSTQLFQSPTPQEEHFSRLVATLLDFFETGTPSWDARRAVIEADFCERIGK
jgi:hypothetical protein